jgi:hypothetical protein
LVVIVFMTRISFYRQRHLYLRIVRDLLAGDPAAVEAERDTGRQVDTCDGLAGEVLCGEDDQVGGAAAGLWTKAMT